MKSVFAFGSFGAAAFLGLALALVPACSSKTANTTNSDVCEDAKCAPGNKCLAMDGEIKCRKTCASNTDPATACPAGATCAAGNSPSTIVEGCTKADAAKTEALCGALITEGGSKLNAYMCGEVPPKGCVATATPSEWCCNDAPAETFPEPFCVKQLRVVPPGPKRFGAACNGSGGVENPDCDAANGFYCYGTGPGDGASYCTRYDCQSDRECAPNFYCATINVAPNVKTSKPSVQQLTTACLRRDYCAPCKADLDCPPVNNLPQRCVPDDNYVGFCAPECKSGENCPKDAKCIDGGIGVKTCYPRAGACVGDGSLCSPCRSDADCGTDGACVSGQYTTERSCAKKSAITCKTGSVAGTDFKCPASANAKAVIRCRGDVFEQVPMNYCHGLYGFGESADIGCYTPAVP